MALYFLSDSHLGARYISDPRQHEARLIQMLQMMSADAEAIYLLGDIIDFWFEYKSVVPKGYLRFLSALASLADRGIAVYWLHGNHDMWTGKYLEEEIGINVVSEEFLDIDAGECTIVVSHGDTVGHIPLSYRLLRWLFHNHTCRRLLSMIHPRLTMAVGHGWSAHSRKSSPRQIKLDILSLRDWAVKYLSTHPTQPPTRFIICGHMHVPAVIDIPDTKARLVILGENYSMFEYARYCDGILQIKHFATSQSNDYKI